MESGASPVIIFVLMEDFMSRCAVKWVTLSGAHLVYMFTIDETLTYVNMFTLFSCFVCEQPF